MTPTDISRLMLEDPTLDASEDAPRYAFEVESYSPTYAVLRASGDLDMTSRTELIHMLDQLTAAGSHVTVDLSAVSFMYSGAASALIDAASMADGRIRLFGPTRPVRMIVEALGGTDLLDTRLSFGVTH
ncbi:STAS domain-containing protein [Rhodococcoides yunnanense]|uniref:STAS domain-containing protein n=1 Tax=Rhodococcoides yunnanense TaxID=278209 RepID=UPI000A01EA74|nr:STAS domain-containing protein [Rhodococcus yunnanensis]